MSSDLNKLEGQFMAGAIHTLDLIKLRSELMTEYPSQLYDTKIGVEILQKHVPDDLKPMEILCARRPDLFKSHLNLAFIQKVTSEILHRPDKEYFQCMQRVVWQGISDLSSNYANTPEYGNPASFERLTALRVDLRKAHYHYECSKVDHMITLELRRLEPHKDQASSSSDSSLSAPCPTESSPSMAVAENISPLAHHGPEVKFAIKSVASKYHNLRCTDPRQTIYLVYHPAAKIYTLLASDISGENPQTVPGFLIDPEDPESVTTGFWSNGHGRQTHSSAFIKRDPARYLMLDFASRYGACQFSAHLNVASNGRVRFLKIERAEGYHIINQEEIGMNNLFKDLMQAWLPECEDSYTSHRQHS